MQKSVWEKRNKNDLNEFEVNNSNLCLVFIKILYLKKIDKYSQKTIKLYSKIQRFMVEK